MKRIILIPITVLVLASLSCAFFGKTAKPSAAPTAAIPKVTATNAATATIPQPTETREEPTATMQLIETEAPTSIPTEIPAEIPTDTPAAPLEYEETFDRDQGNWSEDLIVTTQTSGRNLYSEGAIQDGVLRFLLMDKETYMYKFFQAANFSDVTIEADFNTFGHMNNGIAIVCKVNDERTQWYEARVSSTSDYSLYLYDKSRRTDLGKNPYLQIGKGKFKIDELYPAKPNTIQLTCLGNEMILNANHDKRIISQILETPLDGSGVGLGAMSYDVTPITINFEKITIREEN